MDWLKRIAEKTGTITVSLPWPLRRKDAKVEKYKRRRQREEALKRARQRAMARARERARKRRGFLLLFALLPVLNGCQTTITTQKSVDPITGQMHRQSVIRVDALGRIFGHAAEASTSVDSAGAWKMQTGDSVGEMSFDPEVVSAAVEGGIQGGLEAFGKFLTMRP